MVIAKHLSGRSLSRACRGATSRIGCDCGCGKASVITYVIFRIAKLMIPLIPLFTCFNYPILVYLLFTLTSQNQ